MSLNGLTFAIGPRFAGVYRYIETPETRKIRKVSPKSAFSDVANDLASKKNRSPERAYGWTPMNVKGEELLCGVLLTQETGRRFWHDTYKLDFSKWRAEGEKYQMFLSALKNQNLRTLFMTGQSLVDIRKQLTRYGKEKERLEAEPVIRAKDKFMRLEKELLDAQDSFQYLKPEAYIRNLREFVEQLEREGKKIEDIPIEL